MRWLSALFLLGAMSGLLVNCGPTYCEQYPGDPQCSPSQPGGTLTCDQPASTTGIDLGVPYMPQQCTQLCWAGSIAMIANYFGKPVQECQLASEKIRLSTGYVYNCCNVFACNDPYCNVPGSIQEVANLFGYSLGIHGVLLPRPLTEQELQVELTNGRPVMVFYQGAQVGHYAVISGFVAGSPALYHVDDPWPSFGSLQMPYQSIRQGPNSEQWYMSYAHLSPSANPCAGR